MQAIEAIGKSETVGAVGELGAGEEPDGRCAVCGSDEVERDAVARPGAAGWLLLGACRHCDHLWTRPLSDVDAPRAAARVARAPEVVRAA